MEIMTTKLVDYDPQTASEELSNSFLDLLDELFKEENPRDPLMPRDIRMHFMKNPPPGELRIRKLVMEEETQKTIGFLFLLIFKEGSQQYENNKHTAMINISFHKEHYSQNYAIELMKTALEIVQVHKEVTTIDACSFREREWKFWESLEAKLALEGAENRLYLEDANWDLIEEWRKEGHQRAKEERIELISFQRCPEEIIEGYTSCYTELIKLIPMGEFDFVLGDETLEIRREKEQRFEKLEYEWYTLATREENGDFSGLTEIFYHRGRPHKVDQELTGVTPKYRGRGLGKWLKAEMLLFIQNEFPDVKFILTGNANMNAPMLSINERMGFKEHLKEKCYTIKLTDLVDKLKTVA